MTTPTIHWMLRQIGGDYSTGFLGDGGLGGSCYGCLFASDPQRSDGSNAEYYEYANDPSEAWFTCSLPTRDPAAPKPEWGEYSPCSPREWTAHLLTVIPDGPAQKREGQA